ncbi:MAG: transposase [Streptococcaceae bacterium]|jgi:putative transposase|nr:transposase [Streptococcaceae bacterium]
MILGTKIRIIPTKEQESFFWQSAGVARWAYNFALRESQMWYQDTGETLSQMDIRKFINNVLKPDTHSWLKQVGSNVMKQAVIDFGNARQRFFDGKADYPKLKKKYKSKPSFFVNHESLKRTKDGFRGEKIGFIKTSQPLPKLTKGQKYYKNPRITHDGRNWYLSIGLQRTFEEVELTDVSLGVDVGVKELAVVSNNTFYKNINKTKRVKQLEKRLKRKQRQVARMLGNNTKGYTNNRKPIYIQPLKDLKNFQKKKHEISLLHKKLTDIRQNHLHQATSEIVKTKPSRIVMETLNIKGMMKNKHLSKAIAAQKLFEFQRQITYKAQKFGIEVIKADKWFPSSKICSECGHKKVDLKLKDRTYYCIACHFKIDRDLNAALNLANYSI